MPALVLVAAVAIGAQPAEADVINGSFETGDFTGWTQTSAGGSQHVVDSYVSENFATSYSPIDGSFFAVLGGGRTGELVSLEQTVDLSPGDTLTGWAFFSSNEFQATPENDFASVEIFNSAAQLVARPFFLDAAAIGFADGPWTPWSFAVTTAGTYRLRMGVANVFDDEFASVAGFDAVRVTQGAQVPEPSALLVLSLGFLISRWRRPVGRL